MALITFPDGSRVRASSIFDRYEDDPERAWGLYADPAWEPTWPAEIIDWQDFGIPDDSERAAQQIAEAFAIANAIARGPLDDLVEVGCVGGSGRTGTILACMAVLAGVPSEDAVSWVRTNYRPEAVETAEQEEWVQWFTEWHLAQDETFG